jgi:dihydroneopterin aldolase
MKSIEVNGIKVYGYHGCLDEEALVGTWFEADISLEFDYTESALTDDLSKTIDYVRVRELVEKEIKTRSKLIETVIKRMADVLKEEFPHILSMRLKLRKHNAPIGGQVDHVAMVWEESFK